jgi:hypothetical protein
MHRLKRRFLGWFRRWLQTKDVRLSSNATLESYQPPSSVRVTERPVRVLAHTLTMSAVPWNPLLASICLVLPGYLDRVRNDHPSLFVIDNPAIECMQLTTPSRSKWLR